MFAFVFAVGPGLFAGGVAVRAGLFAGGAAFGARFLAGRLTVGAAGVVCGVFLARDVTGGGRSGGGP